MTRRRTSAPRRGKRQAGEEPLFTPAALKFLARINRAEPARIAALLALDAALARQAGWRGVPPMSKLLTRSQQQARRQYQAERPQ